MQTYIECEDIIKIYPQKSKVKKATLAGLNLSVNQGNFVSIMGPSGCGKTTLVRIIGGLLEPSAGSLKIGGHLINEYSSKEKIDLYRKKIGLMFQNPRDNILWCLNVFDNVMLPMMVGSSPLTTKDKKEKVLTLLRQVDLEMRVRNKPHQLSGGELQKLGVTIALANRPELLILDEPTSNLDTVNAIKLVDHLQLMCKEHNITIIMVTHDLRLVKQTDCCYIMNKGKLTEINIEHQIN